MRLAATARRVHNRVTARCYQSRRPELSWTATVGQSEQNTLGRRMSHDTDKLIRQLSLVAFLMAERRALTARDVKSNVEGYSEMSDEAFARRFYSDRAELLALGVPLDSQRDEFTGEELYTLRSERYFLRAFELEDEELAALQTGLFLLEGTFAYAEPLRLALQNLALGRPGFEQPPSETADRVEIRELDYSPEMPGRLAKLESAISKQRTVQVQLPGDLARRGARADDRPVCAAPRPGRWYVIGQDHDRDDDPDVPRFAHPRRHPLRDPARARLPASRGLRRRDVPRPRRTGRSARPSARRGSRCAGDTAWWVERATAKRGRLDDGVFVTDYANLGALASWILRQDGRAVPLAPAELRREVKSALRQVRERHEGDPPKLAREAARADEADRSASGPARPVAPERFGLLQALLAYLLDACGEDTRGGDPGAGPRRRASAFPPSRWRSTCRCSTSSTSAAAATPSTPSCAATTSMWTRSCSATPSARRRA